MTNEEILAQIQEAFPEAIVEVPEDHKDFTIVLKAEHLLDVARYLRDELEMDYLSSVTSVDEGRHFEVVYHVFSMAKQFGPLVLKVRLPREQAEVASLTPIWQGATFQEREVYDLMGIRFTGHPDLRRIFLWEGFPGHPLRKDFECAWPIDTDELVAIKYSDEPQDLSLTTED